MVDPDGGVMVTVLELGQIFLMVIICPTSTAGSVMLIAPNDASAITTAAPLQVADADTDCTPVANPLTVVVPLNVGLSRLTIGPDPV